MKEEKYKVNIRCNNCEHTEEIEIEKSKKISDAKCPNCGCKELNSFREKDGSRVFSPEEW